MRKKFSPPTPQAHLSSRMITSPKYRIPPHSNNLPPAHSTSHPSYSLPPPADCPPPSPVKPPPSVVRTLYQQPLLTTSDLRPTNDLSSAPLGCWPQMCPRTSSPAGRCSQWPQIAPPSPPMMTTGPAPLAPPPPQTPPPSRPSRFLCTVATPSSSPGPCLPPHG